MSKEERSERFSMPLSENPNWKGGISFKVLCPVRKVNMKKHKSAMCYECSLQNKHGEKNSFYGKTHTAKTRKKLSESKKGNIPTTARKVKINNTIYPSATEAARNEGCVCATILNRVKSKKFTNYSFVDNL